MPIGVCGVFAPMWSRGKALVGVGDEAPPPEAEQNAVPVRSGLKSTLIFETS